MKFAGKLFAFIKYV